MAKKQATPKNNNDSTGEEQQLVAKVDQMMATEHQDMAPNYEPETKKVETSPSSKEEEVTDLPKKIVIKEDNDSSNPPPLDIFAEVPGPPPLNGKSEPKASIRKTATKIAVVDNANQSNDAIEVESVPEPKDELEEDEAEEVSNKSTPRSENFDDPVIKEAIEDIVAHEGDIALSVQDATQANAEANSLRHNKGHTHHLFWTLVALVSLIAIIMALFIINPSVHNPFHNLRWSSIRHHL